MTLIDLSKYKGRRLGEIESLMRQDFWLLIEENERLRADLLEYGGHQPKCLADHGRPCTCGYTALRRELEEAK